MTLNLAFGCVWRKDVPSWEAHQELRLRGTGIPHLPLMGNKLPAGRRIKACGANTGDIAWGLISAETKDWWLTSVTLMLKRMGGGIQESLPLPLKSWNENTEETQLFYLLHLSLKTPRSKTVLNKTQNCCEHLHCNDAYIFVNNTLWSLVSLNWGPAQDSHPPPLGLRLNS